MANKKILVSWQVVPNVKIPFPPLESPKESKLALARITKVCWSTFQIRCCWAVSVEWATFTATFNGLSMMYSNVIGLRNEGLYAKIPEWPSTTLETFLAELYKTLKVGCSTGCWSVVFGLVFPSFVAESMSKLAYDSKACSSSMLLVVILEPSQYGSAL